MTQFNPVSQPAGGQASFIAVDWGTTNLRAFLMNQDGHIQAQRDSDRGMLKLGSAEFESVLSDLLGDWLTSDLTIYMAGMVGSRGGWQEVPYQQCPIKLEDLSEHLFWLTTSLPNKVAIVPGLRGTGVAGLLDVMRGEETQLLGALDWLEEQGRADESPIFCLPGTHCKWAQITEGKVTQFSTSITGELFARLNDESSLVKGLPKSDQLNEEAFKKGVQASLQAGGILHHLFSARSRFVCGELAADEVRDYLSGVVIGHDVNDTLEALKVVSLEVPKSPVLIIGSEALSERYALALSSRDLTSEFLAANEASIRGLKRLANRQAVSANNPTTGAL
ncbi:MAG: 2-dehydro-3-deoxygalactonokinase [Gammaproteobacteria bacterium]|jgi:2-dehydro-3-deoxygalactonokinase|uniref:2-dehydro-3-deoxygalactonokinase n=1 Tax=Marinomonas sp. BSi20584 TaxID=1594462 RepID=UPI000C1F3F0B|nr:2-dehydro-3-deoxygalactonokinase [Marinomonas sp. BSi20584]MBU1294591.1 2-dehydro-3-deoxygalactonokinase [Gammaproteobacteria bacterium]MBU1465403.1 2-dehydro-3-deoxygalactonokinase [Gammaproteobacteria bacterium]MBU2023962.1 2-dehydro-3-deoxygalactonokinase [Gammaproteobacteria bacterium]MBU2240471.1 2-dehydro-3-deoxygalactonokinase [Gammaproteobacteria bacterium]MBU2318623.1 2-dehydro-3-deoxygalactonokinase [Gammaproteobacteria bacterium]